MSARIGDVYFDTCTLSNFAVVDRLDLLEERYGYRARWTETVQWEIRRGLSAAPHLQRVLDADWLGEPIEVGGDPIALTEINNIRRGLGAHPSNQTDHLGEAEPPWIFRRENQLRSFLSGRDRGKDDGEAAEVVYAGI